MSDLIDRELTAWNRAWIMLTGLWIGAVGAKLSGWVAAVLLGAGVLLVAVAAGMAELSLVIWYRWLGPSIADRRRKRARSTADTSTPIG